MADDELASPGTLPDGSAVSGQFGFRGGGDLGPNGRELNSFSIRYSDGSTYELTAGCKTPRRTDRGNASTRPDQQVIQNAVDLIKDPTFAEQELARLNRWDKVDPHFTIGEVNNFAEKLKAGCIVMREPNRLAMNF